MLTQEKLKEILSYDQTTGVFVRLVSGRGGRSRVGDVVGCPNGDGYLHSKIKGKHYLIHRLAFLFVEGYFPENQVDHKNGVVTDNRWLNLREVTQFCNMQNQRLSTANKSGFTGVIWHKQAGKWNASIRINRKLIHIGLYATATDAAIARVEYEDNCPGWTCNHQATNRVKLRDMGAI